MTRRSSQRALAREIYRDLAAKKDAAAQTPLIPAHSSPNGERSLAYAGIQGDHATPVDGCPGSPLEPVLGPAKGRTRVRGRAEENPTAQNLTEKVRALYEHSAVPVAEIAKLVGVTERTIYKYAAKGQWKPRYASKRRGAGAADGARARGRRAGERLAPDFVPVRGAGGRFIRRADKGKPFAAGLKATDPRAAAEAGAACGRAAALARAAQRRVAAEQRDEAQLRANETVNRALADLNRYCAARAKAGQPGLRDDDRVAQLLVRTLEIATERWQRLLAR